MESSLLTSPEEFVYSVGLFGPAFSVTYVAAAVAVGLLGGLAAWWLEARGLLSSQARMATARRPPTPSAAFCGTCDSAPEPAGTGRLLTIVQPPHHGERLAHSATRRGVVDERQAARDLLPGLRLSRLPRHPDRPRGSARDLARRGQPLGSVPLAALIGIPVYLNTEGSLPLVASLLDGGMSPGAALAFLITGAGTSIGSISGMLPIAHWRIVALVVGTLFVTALATGWLATL